MDNIERYLDPDRGAEDPTFCLHCGGAELIRLPENTAPGHDGPRCLHCNTMWVRSFTPDCPECGRNEGWVHLRTPVDVTLREDKVVLAVGTAWCDACALPWAYRWEMVGEEPMLRLIGFGRGEGPHLSITRPATSIGTHS